MPTTTPPGTSIDMSGAPGADISFDDLFPVEPQSNEPQTQPGTTPPVPPQAPVVAPTTPEFYLKGSKSVYKTPEDAIKGLDTKDDLIDRYRNYLAQEGIDPNTLAKKPAPQAQPANPDDELFDKLSAAVGKGDKKGYAAILRDYNAQLMTEQFAPVAPLISEVARQRAVRQVSQEVPEFGSFISSDDYRQTLDSLPRLKQAIEAAENNFAMSDSLTELYKIGYLASQGRRKPEPAAPVAAPVQSTPAARPGTSPSTMTPPQPSAPPDMRTSDGRKALIRDLEARGILDRQF